MCTAIALLYFCPSILDQCRFVNGEKASIDVSDDFEKIILELDRNLYNNNHAETRRHISLDDFNQNKNVFADIEAGFEEQISNQDLSVLIHCRNRSI